jgi:hypothetical protein
MIMLSTSEKIGTSESQVVQNIINTMNSLIDEENNFINNKQIANVNELNNFEVFFVDKVAENKFDPLNKYLTKEMWNQYK